MFLTALGSIASTASPSAPGHVAVRPPMGWNSWDCFATTVTEQQVLDQAKVLSEKLKPYGWNYVVVDIQWYEPGAEGFEYREHAPLEMDDWGRLQPAINRFPSARGGAGFRPLARQIHAMGLKFGVHLMRGIPRQAVEKNLPILSSSSRAQDVADTQSVCPWNTDMYGVRMSSPGAQDYYDSVFKLLAQWGVDFVKVDDITVPPWAVAKGFKALYHADEAEGIRSAIKRSGRKMILSLSPGEAHFDAAEHLSRVADMWRISDDFWDDWGALKEQFARCEKWAPISGRGHWPDADMLPLGRVRFGQPTNLTLDEQKTMLSLWAMFRSPLILGCDLTKLDATTLDLITNRELIQIDQHGHDGRQVRRDDNEAVWRASGPKGAVYIALFNLTSRQRAIQCDSGTSTPTEALDVWSKERIHVSGADFSLEVPAHGVRLIELPNSFGLRGSPQPTR